MIIVEHVFLRSLKIIPNFKMTYCRRLKEVSMESVKDMHRKGVYRYVIREGFSKYCIHFKLKKDKVIMTSYTS